MNTILQTAALAAQNNFLSEAAGFYAEHFSDITKVCLIFGVSVFIFLMFLILFKLGKITEFENKKRREEKIKAKAGADYSEKKKKSDMMDQLSKLVTEIFDSEDENAMDSVSKSKIRGTNLPLTMRLKKVVRDLMYNPYNTISVPKMILCSLVFSFVGAGVGTLLTNVVMVVALAIVGLVAPIIYVSIASLKNQLTILQSNLGLITSHIGIYKESNSLTDSFRALLGILTPGKREYKAIYKAHGALTEANINMFTVIEELKNDLLVDTTASQYFDMCYIADTKSSEYKESLDYIPVRMEPIVIKNIFYSRLIYIGFSAYVICAVLIVVCLFYYKYAEPASYDFISTTLKGQTICFALMLTYVAIGFIFSKLANIIKIM